MVIDTIKRMEGERWKWLRTSICAPTLEKAQEALARVHASPSCKDPEHWEIGHATYNLKPGYVINYKGTMDPGDRNRWAAYASEWRDLDILLWGADTTD